MNKNAELIDKIEQMGQDSEEKGKKAVQQFAKEKEQEEKKKEAEALDKLNTKNYNLYWDRIKNEAKRKIREYDIPRGFYVDCGLTSKGLVIGYKHYTDSLWFMKGMKISTLPTVDLWGVDKLINEALDEIDRRQKGMEQDHKTAGGVILPGGKHG